MVALTVVVIIRPQQAQLQHKVVHQGMMIVCIILLWNRDRVILHMAVGHLVLALTVGHHTWGHHLVIIWRQGVVHLAMGLLQVMADHLPMHTIQGHLQAMDHRLAHTAWDRLQGLPGQAYPLDKEDHLLDQTITAVKVERHQVMDHRLGEHPFTMDLLAGVLHLAISWVADHLTWVALCLLDFQGNQGHQANKRSLVRELSAGSSTGMTRKDMVL